MSQELATFGLIYFLTTISTFSRHATGYRSQGVTIVDKVIKEAIKCLTKLIISVNWIYGPKIVNIWQAILLLKDKNSKPFRVWLLWELLKKILICICLNRFPKCKKNKCFLVFLTREIYEKYGFSAADHLLYSHSRVLICGKREVIKRDRCLRVEKVKYQVFPGFSDFHSCNVGHC